MKILARSLFTTGVMLALAGCATPPQGQASNIDPATNLPACGSNTQLQPNSGNRIVQSPNSLPVGSKELSASCQQGNVARPYLTQ